ncbi:hypothetical protein PHYBOEH_004614 [Phytophthora boehmeriae]|uniref:PH domain-containing protein n=1 Tax=Phytophthora boehmeriae TaxID=109152 RepID=A0A8T1WLB3_9STRA|nr:hypothetical protein PHYBOEH_004614 [Phytophthora boehmeriae]
MAAALSEGDLVPLCTCPEGADFRSLCLNSAGVDVLQGPKLSSRKVALVGIIRASESEQDAGSCSNADRGLFLSSNGVSIAEQDASMLLLVLKGVSLANEPFWGSLLLTLSSHVVVLQDGPITDSSFQAAVSFLKDFVKLQMAEGTVDEDKNVLLLKELAPRFTWGAVDLKIKDMNGCESPSIYFEQQLAAGSTDAQVLLGALIPTRDCLVVKSNSFRTPEEPHTSAKMLTHVADKLECKSFFGRFLNGSLLVRLVRSLTHAMATQDDAPVVVQRVVTNVYAAHWQELVRGAYKAYCDLMHARLAVYERAPITAEYLVDVTERKLQANQSQSNHHVAVVNAGQGNFSAFDEFGNLKKHQLLTYKNNLEAMISQYNFVARGPQVATVLAGFLNGPVRRQLQFLTQQEYERFSTACEEKEHRVEELEESLENQNRQVQQINKTNSEWSRQEQEAVAEIEQTHAEQLNSLQGAIRNMEAQVAKALADQQALYQSTMQATRRTIDTVDKVADKGRVVSGYLERYEKGHLFSSRWRQYFYVVKHAELTCYKSKSAYEERGPPFERPISISGYSVVRSRTDDLKIKLVPPEAGLQMLRFRAPASVGRETWMKRFIEATQSSSQ